MTVASFPDRAPLGPDDFDVLDQALDAMREHEPETPQWEFCEGFIAALICMRRPVPPAEYWPVLMGEDFVPAQHMEFVWRWKQRWLEIEEGLAADVQDLNDEHAWQPELLDVRGAVLAMPEADRAEFEGEFLPSLAQIWAVGFMYAVESWPEEWRPPRDKDAAALLDQALDAIVALTEDDLGKPTLSLRDEASQPPSVSQERIDTCNDALWAVYDLHRLWHSLGPRVVAVRKPATPGRNDPCPCGSGKKFKKCHGAG